MDKKPQLIEIVKKAALPVEIEGLVLDDINKQQMISDDYILQISDVLERLGNYFKTAGEIQSEYLDAVLEEAQKAGDAMGVLDSIADELEKGEISETSEQTQASENSVMPTSQTPPAV